MNRKGQALVEFIIILPIIIFMLLAIIDYGTISYTKSKLENIVGDVSSMLKNKETMEEIQNFVFTNDKYLKIQVEQEDKYINLKLYKEYDYITPGLSKLFNNNEISVERTIYYE